MLCAECDKRNICTELCGAAAGYADQDKPNYHKPGGTHFSDREKKILRLLTQGKTKEEVAKTLGITRRKLKDSLLYLKKKGRRIAI